ncbi:gamma-glutamyl-gamma-aminobutyrate hydrolase family protein [Streptomyces sp. A7024]|uniref:Gamma-glutamyl-gamma-aminobutyrate hydrolase family protein n=1 Tax=Streptomyces coryli TaxID=1128680 RepID=A0A6G4TYU8_9ACTN|nr:gamma-glutamyl-gamma-aminobutyrate hydrolase family protein [Streptomyces coryli]NGN64298.1 gamma-glutamyl-gamma-aminobutyrate hydrolase family protein [Streptomyces coryli]
MRRPLIGISTYLVDEAAWSHWRLPAALLPSGYHRLVQRSGGMAALLPPDSVPGAAHEAVARLDGLVVAGGPDVEPGRYGASPEERTGPPAPERDAWELALIEAALERELPLLGICRGSQLLNVACGGTLLQHLDGHDGPPGVFAEHAVKPVPGTRLAALLEDAGTVVPTYHHQAVDRVGEGLVVSAHADDGTVEGLERPGDAFVLGVQWHPEMGDDLRVMQGLVRAAS